MSATAPPARLVMSRSKARRFGLAAVLVVFGMEVAAALGCGVPAEAETVLLRLLWLLIPLSPALVALFTPNPLCAVAAAIPVATFIAYAYHVDCIRPYQGGGASMIYIAVWFYGFLSAAAAALLAIPLLRLFRVRVGAG